ncbi:putative glucan synthasis protein [Owenweeksia hongkongensis DSM 17368]|uniref:Putative glucan synthasis protein n=1 Tax=Owenweeksia hongkongensis (strain DSM 17368 / CIP 108786 / JCM 12287 / NRRL B-23963 / UST20020801) TaxID=926562 RepID=G8R7V9_OWEHD|nr:SMI1/KNR4 family protein [Owenweeksia hongkongensis]AEV33490.1 putative glucan synthasis protein [Owenweeksia hongkongensis DSM 17368]
MDKIIDKYLDEIITLDLNSRPIKIEPEMADKNADQYQEWNKWFPIKSTVTDKELQELEKEIGYKLPDSYKSFLKHKHFYEFYIAECSFCSHPVNTWRVELMKMIFNDYPSENLIETGRIPFASWSDWGLLCFDTTLKCENFEYPIVLWDHEVYDEFQLQYENFENMMIELAQEHEEQRG